ncbi:MAG: ABC transporter permease [Bacteroidetes bacterium]|nr:ABC transporter permease [Bacteroidota bacterium]
MDLYYLEETFQTLKQHKIRSILTGFGVTWGVFSLVILLGLGSGLKKGVFRGFEGMSKNSIWIWGQRNKHGDFTFFNSKSVEYIKNKHKFIKKIGTQSEGFYKRKMPIAYKEKSYNGGMLSGVNQNFFSVSDITLKDGRNFNNIDFIKNRKVCILGNDIKKELFPNINPIGKYINVGNTSFIVIATLEIGKGPNNRIKNYVLFPMNTYQFLYRHGNDEITMIVAQLNSKTNANKAQKTILKSLKEHLKIHPKDENAIKSFNLKKQIQKINNLFKTINLFIWSISICFLLSGVVGVGNMMLVIIKERIKEIGIRKVIGAKPREILNMLMTESILITLVSGILGLIIGNGILKITNALINHYDTKKQMMLAEMDFDIVSTTIALIILIIAGALAGYIPAKKAVNMLPIKALSEE